MGFWIFMFIMDLLCPLVMIAFGRRFINNPPKSVNSFYGYRTKLSMKNETTWKYAHKIAGKIWLYCGLVLLPLSVVAMLFFIGKDIDTVGTAGGIISYIQIIVLLLTILLTEIELHKHFDKIKMEIYAQGKKIVEEKTMVDKLMVSQDGREVIQKLADLRQSLKTAKMMVWQGRLAVSDKIEEI